MLVGINNNVHIDHRPALVQVRLMGDGEPTARPVKDDDVILLRCGEDISRNSCIFMDPQQARTLVGLLAEVLGLAVGSPREPYAEAQVTSELQAEHDDDWREEG